MREPRDDVSIPWDAVVKGVISAFPSALEDKVCVIIRDGFFLE